jgi:hypothetical protein
MTHKYAIVPRGNFLPMFANCFNLPTERHILWKQKDQIKASVKRRYNCEQHDNALLKNI